AADGAACGDQSIAATTHRYQARVTVHAPADEVAARLPWAASALAPIDATRCEYRIEDDDLEWLAQRIVMLGADVEVHEPPELVTTLRAIAGRLHRAVGDGV